MVLFDLFTNSHPGVILDNCVTAEAASKLTGYNIQHMRRDKLDALVKVHGYGPAGESDRLSAVCPRGTRISYVNPFISICSAT